MPITLHDYWLLSCVWYILTLCDYWFLCCVWHILILHYHLLLHMLCATYSYLTYTLRDYWLLRCVSHTPTSPIPYMTISVTYSYITWLLAATFSVTYSYLTWLLAATLCVTYSYITWLLAATLCDILPCVWRNLTLPTSSLPRLPNTLSPSQYGSILLQYYIPPTTTTSYIRNLTLAPLDVHDTHITCPQPALWSPSDYLPADHCYVLFSNNTEIIKFRHVVPKVI